MHMNVPSIFYKNKVRSVHASFYVLLNCFKISLEYNNILLFRILLNCLEISVEYIILLEEVC